MAAEIIDMWEEGDGFFVLTTDGEVKAPKPSVENVESSKSGRVLPEYNVEKGCYEVGSHESCEAFARLIQRFKGGE